MDYKVGDLVWCLCGPYNCDDTCKIIEVNNGSTRFKILNLNTNESCWGKEEWFEPISSRDNND